MEIAIVVHIPFGWDHQYFWHRRKPTEALAGPLKAKGAVLIVEPVICPITGLYRKVERKKIWQCLCQSWLRKEGENLYILTPFVWLPMRWQHLQWIRTYNSRTLTKRIRRALRNTLLDVQVVVSWFYRPEQVDLVGLANENYVVYECYDQHWEGVRGTLDTRDRIKRQEHQLFNKVDLVFVTSETLLKEKQKWHSNVHLACNAADVAYFGQVQSPDTIIPEVIDRFDRPVIGYLGTIHSHTDIKLLKYVAEARPDWSLLLVGPEQDLEFSHSALFQQFRSLSNVHLTGWVAAENIPSYFKAVDVCVLPYCTDSEFNKYVNPNKLHEYTAMGKPVVSTDIPCVRSHDEIIYIAETKEKFVACIEKALAENGRDRISERLHWAQKNSLERRSRQIVDILFRCLTENGLDDRRTKI